MTGAVDGDVAGHMCSIQPNRSITERRTGADPLPMLNSSAERSI